MIRFILWFKEKRWFFVIQGLTILFSLSGVIVKVASIQMQKYGFFAFQTFFLIVCFCVLMMIYAFFWQKVIAHLPLSTAYLGKSLAIFWSLVWSHFFFGEYIGIQNILGALVVFAGTVLVMQDEL